MSELIPNILATGIGSLPHRNAQDACNLVWDLLPEIPFWPQLPKRSGLENMYTQYSEGLPAVVKKEDGGFFIEADGEHFYEELERFYQAIISEDLEGFKISPGYAEGFYTFIKGKDRLRFATAIKGQVTGPISFGLQVTQSDKRSVLYDETLRDVIVKQLLRKAQWQLAIMKDINPRNIIFLDEPYLSAFGSAFTSIDRETALSLINEIVSGLDCITAIHCCGNTDWSLVLDTGIDILSFDAYSFMESLFLYEGHLKRFLNRGGIVAWGIVPTSEEGIREASVSGLISILERGWERLSEMGIDQKSILCHSLITPACGLGTLSIDAAIHALRLLKDVSVEVRSKYHLNW